MIGIFNGFECMADTDILNKMKKSNTTNHMKVWTLQGKIFHLPITF